VNVGTRLTRWETASSSADRNHLMIIRFTYLPNQRGHSPPRADSLALRWDAADEDRCQDHATA
jgi:hypothetical protein